MCAGACRVPCPCQHAMLPSLHHIFHISERSLRSCYTRRQAHNIRTRSSDPPEPTTTVRRVDKNRRGAAVVAVCTRLRAGCCINSSVTPNCNRSSCMTRAGRPQLFQSPARTSGDIYTTGRQAGSPPPKPYVHPSLRAREAEHMGQRGTTHVHNTNTATNSQQVRRMRHGVCECRCALLPVYPIA